MADPSASHEPVRTRPMIVIVAAAADNGVIGRDGGLPWHLPDDLRRFKALTSGHAVIMGRRTFESIGCRPLPRRRNIVVSSRLAEAPEGVRIASSLERAIALAADEDEVFILGGAGVYAAALPLADRLELTRVHAVVDGDVRFPELERSEWRLVASEHHDADDTHEHAFTFETYVREEPSAISHQPSGTDA